MTVCNVLVLNRLCYLRKLLNCIVWTKLSLRAVLTSARRVATVRAVSYCNLYSLTREHFEEVLSNYPLMRRTMETVAAERLNKIGQNPTLVIKSRDPEDLAQDVELVKEIMGETADAEAANAELHMRLCSHCSFDADTAAAGGMQNAHSHGHSHGHSHSHAHMHMHGDRSPGRLLLQHSNEQPQGDGLASPTAAAASTSATLGDAMSNPSFTQQKRAPALGSRRLTRMLSHKAFARMVFGALSHAQQEGTQHTHDHSHCDHTLEEHRMSSSLSTPLNTLLQQHPPVLTASPTSVTTVTATGNAAPTPTVATPTPVSPTPRSDPGADGGSGSGETEPRNNSLDSAPLIGSVQSDALPQKQSKEARSYSCQPIVDRGAACWSANS